MTHSLHMLDHALDAALTSEVGEPKLLSDAWFVEMNSHDILIGWQCIENTHTRAVFQAVLGIFDSPPEWVITKEPNPHAVDLLGTEILLAAYNGMGAQFIDHHGLDRIVKQINHDVFKQKIFQDPEMAINELIRIGGFAAPDLDIVKKEIGVVECNGLKMNYIWNQRYIHDYLDASILLLDGDVMYTHHQDPFLLKPICKVFGSDCSFLGIPPHGFMTQGHGNKEMVLMTYIQALRVMRNHFKAFCSFTGR
jgi:hypothetical protein